MIVRPDQLVSAFINEVNWNLVEEYAAMRDGSDPPPIKGYMRTLDFSDAGSCFMDGREITEEHIGLQVWCVTDGHHRAHAAILRGMTLEAE